MIFRKRDWQDEYDESYADNDGQYDRGARRSRMLRHAIGLFLFAGAVIGVVGLMTGKTMLERIALALVSPCGLVWLGLIVLVYFCFLNKRYGSATIGVLCWALITISGNNLVTNALVKILESPFLESPILSASASNETPFDILLLLGGGTTTTSNNRVQASASGDRVVTAARLFHKGQVKRIVCTGQQSFVSNDNDLHPYEEAIALLVELGVPRDSIDFLPGNNTSQEMLNAAAMIKAQNLKDSKIGIVSSAWHLRRVIRLAKKNGINAVPVPADFLSHHFKPGPNVIIPSSDNMAITRRVLKEHLASLIGR